MSASLECADSSALWSNMECAFRVGTLAQQRGQATLPDLFLFLRALSTKRVNLPASPLHPCRSREHPDDPAHVRYDRSAPSPAHDPSDSINSAVSSIPQARAQSLSPPRAPLCLASILFILKNPEIMSSGFHQRRARKTFASLISGRSLSVPRTSCISFR